MPRRDKGYSSEVREDWIGVYKYHNADWLILNEAKLWSNVQTWKWLEPKHLKLPFEREVQRP